MAASKTITDFPQLEGSHFMDRSGAFLITRTAGYVTIFCPVFNSGNGRMRTFSRGKCLGHYSKCLTNGMLFWQLFERLIIQAITFEFRLFPGI